MRVLGLVPHLPPARPNADPRWWFADGVVEGDTLRIERLAEADTPPPIAYRCGLAAPCSLPRAFLETLDCDIATIGGWTFKRLASTVRHFAARRKRGDHHPARDVPESLSSLDRRRLARYHASIPLLTDPASAAHIIEVDVPLWLRAADLPYDALSAQTPKSIARRVSIVRALEQGLGGKKLELPERDYAIAALPALEAVIACLAVSST